MFLDQKQIKKSISQNLFLFFLLQKVKTNESFSYSIRVVLLVLLYDVTVFKWRIYINYRYGYYLLVDWDKTK